MARRKKASQADPPPRQGPGTRRGAELDESSDEPTLVGHERSGEVSRRQLFVERAQRQRHRVQNVTLHGLLALLATVAVLGTMAMIGVSAGWFDQIFALEVLALTVTPSFGAWLLVVRWAFGRGRKDGVPDER